ncbi:hypothetical protein Gorai_019548 [Gossypium raimondii]|uniref:Uncharacterized protein n=1 Tax=Gossypium raimondii TaxID=29730 RepID=A0A7J8PNK1_GOSRA|nr:hypothetical protein [Gossypium raimondii]
MFVIAIVERDCRWEESSD